METGGCRMPSRPRHATLNSPTGADAVSAERVQRDYPLEYRVESRPRDSRFGAVVISDRHAG